MKTLENLRGLIFDNFGKIALATALVTGISTGAYLFGNYKGFQEGKIRGKDEIIELLEMERYDAHQNAKYAGSLERQNETLKDAESIKRTLELLDKKGYFKGVSEDTYKHEFPNRYKQEE